MAGPSEMVPLDDVSVAAPEHPEVRSLLPELGDPPLDATGAAEGAAELEAPLLETGGAEGAAGAPLVALLEL